MNNNIYWGGADHWYCGYCGKGPGHADDCTRPQPTASVDAEQVWRDALTAFANAGNQAATAVIQAYGDARADAARREALEEAAVAYEAETHTWTAWPEAGAARRKGAKAIRALKGSQQ